jgi:anti-anti-sigma factor
MASYQTFSVQHCNEITLVHLSDVRILAAEHIAMLRQELLRLVVEEQPKKLVINFAQVKHCSSELISTLLVAWKRLASDGGLLRLCGMNENIREVFRITRLEGTVFDIYETAAEAMKNF